MIGRQYRIQELARRCGVSTRTVDYYTQLGLIRATERTRGNYRLYDEQAASRLELVKSLQAQRLSLTEIQARLGALDVGPESPEPTAGAIRALERIGGELARVETEVARLGSTVQPGPPGDAQSLAALRRVAGDAMLRALAVAQVLGMIANDHLVGPH